jgi:hypothetical protein
MGLEPTHPLRVQQHSGRHMRLKSAVPLNGFWWAGRDVTIASRAVPRLDGGGVVMVASA